MKGPCKNCEQIYDEVELTQFSGYCEMCFYLKINKIFNQVKTDLISHNTFNNVPKQGHLLIKWKNLLYSFDLTAAGEDK